MHSMRDCSNHLPYWGVHCAPATPHVTFDRSIIACAWTALALHILAITFRESTREKLGTERVQECTL